MATQSKGGSQQRVSSPEYSGKDYLDAGALDEFCCEVLGEVAAGFVGVGDFDEFGFCGGADGLGQGAAGVEATAGGWVDG